MQQVIYPQPEQQILFAFILESNLLADTGITAQDVHETFSKQALHPCASGHFAAIHYALKTLNNPHFPIRHTVEYSDLNNSHKNLYWLRDLHKKMMLPLARYGQYTQHLEQFPNEFDCGNYRRNTVVVGENRRLPDPKHIQQLMHWWLTDLGEFHLKWAPKINKLGGINMTDLELIEKEAEKKALQLLGIRPFNDGNGRITRFVENMLRLRWGLRWKIHRNDHKMDYIKAIMQYEDSHEWKQILSNNAK